MSDLLTNRGTLKYLTYLLQVSWGGIASGKYQPEASQGQRRRGRLLTGRAGRLIFFFFPPLYYSPARRSPSNQTSPHSRGSAGPLSPPLAHRHRPAPAGSSPQASPPYPPAFLDGEARESGAPRSPAAARAEGERERGRGFITGGAAAGWRFSAAAGGGRTRWPRRRVSEWGGGGRWLLGPRRGGTRAFLTRPARRRRRRSLGF